MGALKTPANFSVRFMVELKSLKYFRQEQTRFQVNIQHMPQVCPDSPCLCKHWRQFSRACHTKTSWTPFGLRLYGKRKDANNSHAFEATHVCLLNNRRLIQEMTHIVGREVSDVFLKRDAHAVNNIKLNSSMRDMIVCVRVTVCFKLLP